MERDSWDTPDARAFFARDEATWPIFAALAHALFCHYPELVMRVQGSQIAFDTPDRAGKPRPFCWAWLPIRPGIRNRPAHYLIVSFGLDRLLQSARFVGIANPYPDRWTYHMLLDASGTVDRECLDFLEQAYRRVKNR